MSYNELLLELSIDYAKSNSSDYFDTVYKVYYQLLDCLSEQHTNKNDLKTVQKYLETIDLKDISIDKFIENINSHLINAFSCRTKYEKEYKAKNPSFSILK